MTSASLFVCEQELNGFRGKCSMLFHYDMISVPLVYTQVSALLLGMLHHTSLMLLFALYLTVLTLLIELWFSSINALKSFTIISTVIII